MKAVRMISCLLLLTALAAAQEWTLYYSDTRTVNGDGSISLTPTVGISGDDGGYCNLFAGLVGYETSSVMLNGNPWAIGDTIFSGGVDYGSTSVNFSYTFPDVTVPAGTEVDLSYAAKVQGICFLSSYPQNPPPYTAAGYYTGAFVDGTSPPIPPSPCWIAEGYYPTCGAVWPGLWALVPPHHAYSDLDSQKVSQKIYLWSCVGGWAVLNVCAYGCYTEGVNEGALGAWYLPTIKAACPNVTDFCPYFLEATSSNLVIDQAEVVKNSCQLYKQ